VVLAGTLWSLPALPDHAKQYLTIDNGGNRWRPAAAGSRG
jgi:hypothetical protein